MIGNVVQNQFLVQLDYPTGRGPVASSSWSSSRWSCSSTRGSSARRTSIVMRRRHRPAHRETGAGRVGRWSRSTAVAVGGFALPVPPDLRDRRVLLQRARRASSTSSGSSSRSTTGRTRSRPAELTDALRRQPEDRGDRDGHRHDPRLADRARARAATGSGAAASSNLLLVLPLTTPEIVLGASLATLFLDRGVRRAGFRHDRHRPRHVLRELRRAHRARPASAASTGRSRTPRMDLGATAAAHVLRR